MRSPRDRALARMRSLLVVAATASTSSACHRQRARGPEEMPPPYPEGYQVSDPVAPPPTQLSIARVDAKWVARGTWGIDASAIEIDLVLATTVPDLLVTIPSSTSPATM